MSVYTVVGHTTYVDGYDMTADLNATSLKITRQAADVTTFSASSRRRIATVEDVQSSVDGYWQAGTDAVDPRVFADLGGGVVVTQTPDGAEGERAYFYRGGGFAYRMFGAVGETAPFSLTLQGVRGPGTRSVGAVAGYLARAKGNVSGTGPLGVAVNLGAVGADQFLYAAVHVFTAGTTLSIDLESDSSPLFGAPSTVATLGPFTAVGGTWMGRVAGPSTNDHFRFTVTGVTGTFTVAAALGVK